jgi:monovalent cation:H+ antiporter-2, CPA2 family
MHEIPLLRDLVILVAIAIPVVVLAHRLRIPTIVGFLVSGIAIGPTALGLVRDTESVASLAEIGVVLLLFAVGLELSLSRIVRMGHLVLRGGAMQVLGTIAAVATIALLLGADWRQGVLFGGLIALSSTAIILKVFADRGELDAAHGRVVIAILLFQDLCVVPLMLLLPLLSGTGGDIGGVLRGILIAVVVTTSLLIVGRLAVPRILSRIVEMRNQEIFTLVVVAIGLGAAYITASFGMSLALGAFLAGLIISESEFGLQALSDVLPFKDTFSGIFFISVGMLLDVRYVATHALTVLAVAAGVLVLKSVIGWGVVRLVRRSSRVGIVAGISLAQVGEFSFILASSAVTLGVLSSDGYQLFLGSAILTMLAAPFAVAAAPVIADRILHHRSMPTMEFATREARAIKPVTDHVIIVGYGLNGRNLARALKSAGIPYVVLESNGQVVRRAKLDREPIIFGDGTRAEVLDRVGIHRARIVVFVIASISDERRAVVVARHLNPSVHIVTRTRYVAEIEELQKLGANEVVPEEFETSLEIFARVLRKYDIPASRIREAAEEARSSHYELLRERGASHAPMDEVLSRLGARLDLEVIVIREGAEAIGMTTAELQLRTRTGAVITGVIRNGEPFFSTNVPITFQAGDEVVIVGDPRALSEAALLFRPLTRAMTAVHPVESPAPTPAID